MNLEQELISAAEKYKLSNLNFSASDLELTAKLLDCQWSVYWQIENDQKLLRPKVIYTEKDDECSKLLLDTKFKSLSISEGMPGHVWKSKTIFITDDLVNNMSLPRSLYAEEAGFNFGLWIPIINHNDVASVFEFLGKRERPLTEELKRAVAAFRRKIEES